MGHPYSRSLTLAKGTALLVPAAADSRTFAIGFPRIGSLHQFTVSQAKPDTAVTAGGGGASAAFDIAVSTVPPVTDSVTEPYARMEDPTDVDEAATLGLPPYNADAVVNRLYTTGSQDLPALYKLFPDISATAAGAIASLHKDTVDHPYALDNHWIFLTITPTSAEDTLWEVHFTLTVPGS